jgi:hypothetical protein
LSKKSELTHQIAQKKGEVLVPLLTYQLALLSALILTFFTFFHHLL